MSVISILSLNEEDIALIRRAYDYAEKKHFGQKRISGDDYILHPLNVALILTEISADAPCMAAALLHDTIEDSDATKEEIEELFGSEVALLVDGVTKINKLNFNNYFVTASNRFYPEIKQEILNFYNNLITNKKEHIYNVQICDYNFGNLQS